MNQRIELNRVESIQYFDADPDMLELFESDPDMITEVSISDNSVMYRIGTPGTIGSATWTDDNYTGALEKMQMIGVV